MAAGLGYKEFTTGDVLTAADANGYLASQVVMVFASAAARTSAIASPQEGMISFLKDTNSTEYYSGAAWVAIAGGSTDISCRVYAGGATSLSTTFASIAFNTENFDTDTMHDNSTNNSRITIKTAGKYSIGGQINIAANSALGVRLLLNGGSVIGRIFQGNSGVTEGANIDTIYDFAVNDYIELQGAVGSGTATTSTDQQTNFWAVKL